MYLQSGCGFTGAARCGAGKSAGGKKGTRRRISDGDRLAGAVHLVADSFRRIKLDFCIPCDCGALNAGRLYHRAHQRIYGGHRRRNYDAHCGCVPCISGNCTFNCGCRDVGSGNPKRRACTGSDRMDAVCKTDPELCAEPSGRKLCEGSKAERSERVVDSAASYISECHPSGRRDRDSAFKRSDAQHFRSELSRPRLFLSRMGKYAFGRTQPDAAVPVGGAVSGACDLYSHYII